MPLRRQVHLSPIFGVKKQTCLTERNKKPTNWWGFAKRHATLYNLGRRSVELMILHQTVTELCAYMPAAPVLCTFVQHLIAFCCRPEASGDVISGKFVPPIVHDKIEKFRDPGLNHSGEIPPEAVRPRRHFRPFVGDFDNCQSVACSWCKIWRF